MPVETAYIASSEYTNYGLPAGTTAPQVNQASRLIDTYCNRPRTGFLWQADATGQPAYQAATKPSFTYTATGAIAPGQNVSVQISNSPLTLDMLGHVLVLDRANTNTVEACVISAVNAPTNGWVQLAKVNFAHSPSCTLDDGMQVFEERYMANERAITRVSEWPVVRVISGLGRTGYGRRSDQVAGLFQDWALVATGTVYGGPALWVPFDPTQCSVSPLTGEIWVPASLLLIYYTEVRLWYCGGWQFSALPEPIKWATANVIINMAQNAGTPMVSGLIKKLQAGDTTVERFSDKVFDAQTQELLSQFKTTLTF